MSPMKDKTPRGGISDDDHRFDLLADGELSESERRELLGRLDDEPSGWRRCALAFLEAQSWKQDFGAVVRESQMQPLAERPGRRFRFRGNAGVLLAMAASFLAALFLGWFLQDHWRTGGATGVGPMRVAEVQSHPEAPTVRPEETPRASGASENPWRLVGGDSGSFRLPAVERERLDDRWLRSLPSAVPDDVLQALERTGHRVQRRRDLVPFRMKDGRQLVVPVDRMDVQYVGRPTL